MQGLVAGRQFLMAGGVGVVALFLGGVGFGGGAEAGQVGVAGGSAGLAEFIANVLGGPGGLDRVGVAQMQEPAVGHAADIRTVGGA